MSGGSRCEECFRYVYDLKGHKCIDSIQGRAREIIKRFREDPPPRYLNEKFRNFYDRLLKDMEEFSENKVDPKHSFQRSIEYVNLRRSDELERSAPIILKEIYKIIRRNKFDQLKTVVLIATIYFAILGGH